MVREAVFNVPNIHAKRNNPVVLLGATWSVIENLGIMTVGEVAKQEGCEVHYCQPKNHDFTEFRATVEDLRPDIVGYNCYSGCQTQLTDGLLEWLKREHPEIRTVMGGPHGTYFPMDFIPPDGPPLVTNVVMSEGLNAFRRIVRGEVGPGIIEFKDENMEHIPVPDREGYYRDSPFHKNSPMVSVFGESGCEFDCEYCNNSTTGAFIVIPDHLRPPQDRLALSLNVMPAGAAGCGDGEEGSCASTTASKKGSRAFPRNRVSIETYIADGHQIKRLCPNVKSAYDQSDIWLQQCRPGGLHHTLAPIWAEEIGLPINGQMRHEMLRGEDGDRRLDLAEIMGVQSITLANESEDPVIRKYVLSRNHPQEDIYNSAKKLAERGIKQRSEQILGLISGTTPVPSKMNLNLDLATLGLNVDLVRQYGQPHVIWASQLVLYAGTGIGVRGFEEGFALEDCRDPQDEFFDRLKHRFLREWVGPESDGVHMGELRHEKMKTRSWIATQMRKGNPIPADIAARYEEVSTRYAALCKGLRENSSVWMSGSELESHYDRVAELQKHFNVFGLIPEGDVLARKYLESEQPFSYNRLGRETEEHLRVLTQRGNIRASEIVDTIEGLRNARYLDLNGDPGDVQIREDLGRLAPYLAVLPTPDVAAQYVVNYAKDQEFQSRARSKGDPEIGVGPNTLSTAVRRYLYARVLYEYDDSPSRVILGGNGNSPRTTPSTGYAPRIEMPERYPPKV
jgi:hypothetical protein